MLLCSGTKSSLSFISTDAAQPDAATYTFAIVPQFHSQSLFRIWHPIIQELNKENWNEIQIDRKFFFLRI